MTHSILDHSQDTHQLKILDIGTGRIFDIGASAIIESVTWTTCRLACQPGVLQVLLTTSADADILEVNEGSRIRWGVNGIDYFSGIIEELEISKDGEGRSGYHIMAVDHLHFLKSAETAYRATGTTASEFFSHLIERQNSRIRAAGGEGLRGAVREPSTAALKNYYFQNVTLHEMLRDSMMHAHVAEPMQFMIRDNLGVLEWRELKALRRPIILGDKSFTESYTYGATINDQTYNVIRVVRDNEDIGTRDIWQVFDSNNVDRWWFRSLTVDADEHMTDAQIRDMANLYLRAYNRPRRNANMVAIGINGLQAGDGIQAHMLDGKIDHGVWIESCEHVYTMESHLMALELYL